jgi:hypothetical protein
MALIHDTAHYNRVAIMAEAHRAYRLRRDKGWYFGDALRFTWGRAREARTRRIAELRAFDSLDWALT